MRILQVITSFQTGGAETVVFNMIPRLCLLGYDVDLCLFNGIETPLTKKLSDYKNVKIHRLGCSYYNPLYIYKLIKIMRYYDVIHTHNSSPQLFAAIANLFCHKKLVTTEHSTNNRKRKLPLFSYIDTWMYRQYNTIVCISDIAEKKLKDYLGQNMRVANVCTIYNGVDVEALRQALPIERKSIGSNKTKFVVVMVAGFREAKDQSTLIRAIGRLSKEYIELWLVGDGDRRGKLEQLVSDLGLQNIVKFLGIRMDVPNILKASDVVVMSSHWEGLSLSNIEGMSVGKPFIASDVDGLREMTQGAGLLFPHGDDKALADIIEQLYSDHQMYQQVADACYQKAKQFDISKMVEQYDKLYRDLQ